MVNLWPLSARGGVLLGATDEDNNSGSSISSSMVVERNSRSRGDESAAYVVLDDATSDILSTIYMCLDWFRSIGSCRMPNILRLVVGFSIRTALWLRRSREVIREEDDGRIRIEYYVFFFRFFMCNLEMYYAKV
jgi:hypothetical protein